jgi:hypothetical protein
MKNNALLVYLFVIILTSCSPAKAQVSQTPISANAQVVISTSSQTLTQTPLPTETPTPIPPTATSTLIIPTLDYNQIKLFGAHLINNAYGSFTQVILDMGNLQGNFYGIGNADKYKCEFLKDNPTQLNCTGNPVLSEKLITFSLFITEQSEPIFSTTYRFIVALPTPNGMYCEVEGLWTDLMQSLHNYHNEPGCYAVTCWIDGSYYGGVEDSCKKYWPWIPPGLFPTPVGTRAP